MKEGSVSSWCLLSFLFSLFSSLWPLLVQGFQKQPDLGGGAAEINLPFTGVRKELQWESTAIPSQAENELITSGVLFRPGEFGILSDERKKEIEQTCRLLNGMELTQALSLRKQTIVTRTVHSNFRLKKQSQRLSQLLCSGKSISELSVAYDQPPVAIMRAILDHRIRLSYEPIIPDFYCKMIIKAIVMGELEGPHVDDLLSAEEQAQLQIARETDTVSYHRPYDTTQRDAATAWEEAVYRFLDQQRIEYMTEQALRDVGATRTPDVLLLDECVINGKLVRWIDCKNFYGSASSKHFLKSVRRQIRSNNELFSGCGAIVYRHGFSSDLQNRLAETLLLDSVPLEIPEQVIDDSSFPN